MNIKPSRVWAGMLTVILIGVCTGLVTEQASGALRQGSTSSNTSCAVVNWLFNTTGSDRLNARLTPIISRAKAMFSPNVALVPVRVRLAAFSSIPAQASAENGAIAPGDLLVVAAQPGYVMRAPAYSPPRAIIGKARGWLVCGVGIMAIQETMR